MSTNPILDELHATRRAILAQYGGDVAAYLRDAQARLLASGRPLAQLPQRSIRRKSPVTAPSATREDTEAR
jgi:hypothetical protein